LHPIEVRDNKLHGFDFSKSAVFHRISMEKVKIIVYILVAILLVNMLLFALGKVSSLVFWVIIIVGYVMYKNLAKIKKLLG